MPGLCHMKFDKTSSSAPTWTGHRERLLLVFIAYHGSLSPFAVYWLKLSLQDAGGDAGGPASPTALCRFLGTVQVLQHSSAAGGRTRPAALQAFKLAPKGKRLMFSL